MKNEKKNMRVFVFQKYGKFWSILLGHFIKHKLLISEEWTNNLSKIKIETHIFIAKISNFFSLFFSDFLQSSSFRSRQHGPRSGHHHDEDFNVRSTTCVTSTPNRQSAPNLSSSISVSGSVFCEQNKLTSPTVANDLTAEIDLSDDLTAGITPIQDSFEDTPMFTPRTNSRIVRIISKQSNVW